MQLQVMSINFSFTSLTFILNLFLIRSQADISGIPVFRAQSQDITALGAAMAAGSASGIEIWDLNAHDKEIVPSDTFLPTTTDDGKISLWI